MSDSTSLRPEAAEFLQTWVNVLSQILAEISGAPMPCEMHSAPPAEMAAPAENDLWIVPACSGALRGEMGLRLPLPSAVRLAQVFMSEPASPAAELSADHREAVLELLRQIHGLFATAIRASWGEVQISIEASPAAPSWPASSTMWVRFGEPDSGFWIELHLSAALVAALRVEPSHESAAQPSISPATDSALPAPSLPHDDKVNLQVLMDVELAVTLRFGSRRLPLKEILELNPGSVIELDRQVPEPIDMLLDGRVVARGDIVVIDGCFGLRVTEVAPAAG